MQNGNSRLFRTPQDVGEIVNYKNVIEIIIIIIINRTKAKTAVVLQPFSFSRLFFFLVIIISKYCVVFKNLFNNLL